MSVFRNSAIGDFTRGGQTTIHFLRMICQVMKKFLRICLFGYFLSVILIFYFSTTDDEKYYTYKYSEAYVFGELLNNKYANTNIRYTNGVMTKTSYASILQSGAMLNYVNNIIYKLFFSFGMALLLIGGVGFFIIRFIYSTGKSQASDDFVRGAEIVDIKTLRNLIKKFNKKNNYGKSSGISISNIELPYRFDKSHVLLVGSTGTGKSVNIREALESIRKQGRKAIVYDVAGNFIKHFYREGRDVILNPMDARSSSWDLFADCRLESDFISFAESLIPDSYRRDFFDIAAKVVFSSLAYQHSLEESPSIKNLMDFVLKVDFDVIAKAVKNTDAASILNEEAGRMAASVRGVIAANTRSLKFLKEGGNKFSIADWIQDESNDSWVFVSCNDKQIDTLRPIITAWFNIFTSNILSLPEDEKRRIYMVIDELPSLNKIPSLKNYLAQGRKYGGSGFIGIQNYSQLVSIYGKHDAESICDLCATWVVLRCNSKEGAKWAAENIGNRESVETNEGLSFGVNDIRDGVSVNKHRVERLVVSPTEIMNLPDLTGFLKLGRGFPVAKFTSEYKNYKTVAEHFVQDSAYFIPKQHDVIEDIELIESDQIADGLAIQRDKEVKANTEKDQTPVKNRELNYSIEDMEI